MAVYAVCCELVSALTFRCYQGNLASRDKTARLWEAASGKEIAVLRGHENSVMSAVFSPDGKTVLTASWDKTARLWEAASGKEIAVLRGHENLVESAVFSPDGKTVLTASPDKTARLWEAASGKQIAVLRGHESYVWSAVFSPDGKTVLTASWDNTARLWDAASGKEIAVLRGHESYVLSAVRAVSAVFSPDGKTVLSGDKTPQLSRVLVDTQDLVDAAKQVVPRCLSPTLRERLFLPPEPPSWCIEMEKWPYDTRAWKDWLKYQRADLIPPLPDTPEWKPWVAKQAARPLNPK